MLDNFEEFVKKNKLFNRKSPVLLALSGGVDSVCLFHLLRLAGFKFSVAHCNFSLRSSESDADEVFVQKLADKFKIQCHSIRFDTKNEARRLGVGTQETARFLRYEWFAQLAVEYGYESILTAHHMDDNTETMLINLIRGTGIAGLHGIPLKSEKLCRPLLFADKIAISEFMQVNNFKFRLDKSNEGDDYLRNRLRHHVVPELRKIDPNVDHAFSKSSHQIAEFESLASHLIREKWSNTVEEKKDRISIPFNILKSMDETLLKPFLFQNLRPLGFTREQTDSLIKAIGGRTGFMLKSSTYQIIRERDAFRISALKSPETKPLLIDHFPIRLSNGDKSISIDKIPKGEIDFSQPDCLYFDLKSLHFPLTLRPWKKGDKMRPIGMKGKKKISDILTNKKVPHTERYDYLVLEDSKAELIALLPNTPADVNKVQPESSEVLRFRIL